MPFGSIEEGIVSVLARQRDALQAEVTPVYVPLLGKNFASDEAEAFDLETSVRQFIGVENQRRVLVLYGDAGSGKSSFFQTLTLSLLAEYTPESPIPLFISLPTLSDPVHRAVEETLENYGFSEVQVEVLKERYSFVFIFDGYDEIHQLQNLYMSNRLNTWQAKLLISCRSQYVYNKGNPDIYFMPLLGERGQPHLLSTLYTAAFNEEQITTYFALMRERGVAIPSDEELQIIPGLKALITTPFLLHMTVGVLPAILARYSAASSSDEDRRLKQMELYDAFITQWFLRQEEKLKLSGHITDDMPDKKPTFWRYAQALAVEMHKHDVTWVSPRDERFAVFFESDAETEMLRSACPLKKSGESFGFWHQSLGTYFTVHTMYEEECSHTAELSTTEPVVMGAGVGAGSGTSDSSVSVPPPIGSIHHRSITDDFSALKLFADQVDARFKARMFDIIEGSKIDERYAIGAANAVTILNWAGVMLIRKNWQGIKIPGANLQYAILAGSDLRSANLKWVNFFRANLSDVNLSGADLTNIQLGEMAPIELENQSRAVAHHPSKPWIAIADGPVIRQFDVEHNVWVGNPLMGHSDAVSSIAYSPDGSRLASGSSDKTIRQWEVPSGRPFGPVLSLHTGEVSSLSYSPDGKRLASGSVDTTVRQWQAESGKPFGRVISGHESLVLCVAYSPDGSRLASGGFDETVRQWRADSGKPFGPVLWGHESEIGSVAYSPDGKLLASGSWVIRQWQVDSGEPFGPQLRGHEKRVTRITYSPDGRRLASSSIDNTIRQWQTDSGEPLGRPMLGHTKPVTCVTYSLDGERLISSSMDGTIRQWDANLIERFGPLLPGHKGWVKSIAYSPNGKRLASASHDDSICQWCADSGEPFGSVWVAKIDSPLISINQAGEIVFDQLTTQMNCIAYSPDGKELASGGDSGMIFQWQSSESYSMLRGHEKPVFSVAYSPDGTRLASGSADGTVRQWMVDSGAPFGNVLLGVMNGYPGVPNYTPLPGAEFLSLLNVVPSPILCIAYSLDGTRLVGGRADGMIRQWDSESGMPFGLMLTGHTAAVMSVTYSPDGERLASGSNDGTVRQWQVASGESFGPVLSEHASSVTSVAYSPDGKQLASGGTDSTIRQWQADSGRLFGPVLVGHSGYVLCVVYSPNGKYLASAGSDGRICLWQKESGYLLWVVRSAQGLLIANGLQLSAVIGLRGEHLASFKYAGCSIEREPCITGAPFDSNRATNARGEIAPFTPQPQGFFRMPPNERTSLMLEAPLLADDNGSDNAEEEGCCSRCSVM